jgi:hypothetical protein
LDGKGNAMLKEKITNLEIALKEQQTKDKEVKTRERLQNRKVEELNREVKDTKSEMQRVI